MASTSRLPKPSYYYPIDEGSEYTPVPEDDNPDDEDYQSLGVPVFEPTMEEFHDFYDYIKRIDRYGMKAGIVKVIPPKEWLATLPEYNAKNLDKIKIRQPIAQHMLGRSGLYKQTNVVKRNVMGVHQWASLAGCGPPAKFQFPAPAPQSNEDLTNETGRVTRGRGSTAKTKETTRERKRRRTSQKLENQTDDAIKLESIEFPSDSETPQPSHSAHLAEASPVSHQQDDLKRSASEIFDSAKPSGKKSKADIANEFYKDLQIQNVWLPQGAQHEDYNLEGCKYLERLYWRTLGLGDNEVSWYGADLSGSLFTSKTKSWNVADLPSYLTELLQESGVGTKLPGVNTPYLYFGTWRATFAWHVEDMDLYSINYIHFGAPKYWYTIPQKQKRKFEQVMAALFPGESKHCPEWLRHKSYLASPHVLASQNLKPSVLVQKQNEFVITFPHGYHSGFNMGFNCAESVNFATEGWKEYGRKARACTCVGDSVKIDVDQLLDRIEMKKQEMYTDDNKRAELKVVNETLKLQKLPNDRTFTHVPIGEYYMPLVAPSTEQQITWMKWAATQTLDIQHLVIQVPWMQERVQLTLRSTSEKKEQAQQHHQQIQAQKMVQNGYQPYHHNATSENHYLPMENRSLSPTAPALHQHNHILPMVVQQQVPQATNQALLQQAAHDSADSLSSVHRIASVNIAAQHPNGEL
ncbi:JmjC-domain-containing protein [Wallemia mellicola]|uniref:JmjC-domain-containing protein n=1 Tax=Wallemia mellicola TaxID=1708541 RepID=A0AB38MI15_9BASI|nr:hypothetical protein E3Q24_01877 [Wallemia mellicola]TIB85647.1 JmjC-domain-containing protein [Wallemia mellicola]TIB88880.1 JmjC-domain-containing protein [Wallemia mellicola]TIC24094.1 JmjC-domain-containing protein [Wallemia mellicola]TIC37876.1 JmjC-domain-containing protein [Wallemia mellicola]